jgi:hypothetical protein
MAEPLLSDEEIHKFVTEWYAAMDRHDPPEEVLPYVVTEGLAMTFPEETLHTHDEFVAWYSKIRNRFFDMTHEVTGTEATWRPDGTAAVKIHVNWDARAWEPPAARSTWLGIDGWETWVVAVEDGAPKIVEYVVDAIALKPGSGTLK